MAAGSEAGIGNPAVLGQRAGGAGERHLRKLIADFNASLDNCAIDTGVEEVHRVRTGSRRLQAIVGTIVREAGAPKALEKPAKAWLRQMKNLRRAAGMVRDLDVHRKLLERVSGQSAAKESAKLDSSSGGAPPAGKKDELDDASASAREMDLAAAQARTLDEWLAGKRHAEAEVLLRQIRKGREKLARRQAAFLEAIEHLRGHNRKTLRPAFLIALEDFARAAESMPLLNAGNLHEFRKLTKKARYVAESGGGNPPATAVAKVLKRVQDEIGEWHDWLGLVGEAKVALRGEPLALAAWLEVRLGRSLVRALRTATEMRGRLLGEWIAAGRGQKQRAPRKPPAKVRSEPGGKSEANPHAA